MKRLFLSLAMMLAFVWASAAPITPFTAQRVAETFWNHNTAGHRAKAQLVQETDFANIYIFSMAEGESADSRGFVIVSADDCAYPILGYSVDSPVSMGEMPANVSFWLGQYEQEIAFLAENPQSVPIQDAERIRAAWKDLMEGTYNEPKSLTSVSPMLTTTWDQSPYYNALCPTGTPAGCAAIAVVQVMKYWNHPLIGTGSHSYATMNYGVLSADFENTEYDWDHMPDRLTSSSSNAQVNAVATLCYHVGVAINMDYAPAGSGAAIIGSNNSAQSALPEYFGYKSTIRGLTKSSYTDAAWITLLEDEIDAGRPVVYAGYDPSAGHAFVFDGYNSNDQFHVNWGWGGSYNGYFAMGALNPMGGGTGSNTTNTFNQSNQALVGIEPDYRLQAAPAYVVLDGDSASASIRVNGNSTSSSAWAATTDASWLSLSPATGSGTVGVAPIALWAEANNTGADRFATVSIVQDSDTVSVTVAQSACSSEEKCNLIINMSDRYGDGWEGAYLTLSSVSGLVYGTATIGGGNYNVVSVPVCPDTVVVRFHQGRTDSECGFFIENAEGNVWVNHVQGNSFSSGTTFVIPAPCDTVGGLGSITYSVSAMAQDTSMGSVSGTGTGIHFGTNCTLKALANPGYRFVKWADGKTDNPRKIVVTSDQVLTAIFSSLGVDTLQYDNGSYSTALGAGSQICWGVKYPESILPGRREVTAIKFFNVYAGTYTITLYEGGDNKPTTQIYSGSVNLGSSYTNMWITLTLDSPITIKQNKNLWVVLSTSNVSYPAAMSGWCGNEDGGMISTNGGSSWKKLSQLGYDGSWMIRTIIPFDPTLYTLTAHANNDSMGTVEGAGSFLYGARASVKAVPNEGYRFVNWDDGSTYNPHTIIMHENTEITANFVPTQPQDIEDAETSSVTLSVQNRDLSIQGAEGRAVKVFDLQGRLCYTADCYHGQVVELPSAGVYVVTIAGEEAHRVVVI